MASLHSIPRFLLPRGTQVLRPRAPLIPLSALRHASTKAPAKAPRTLAEQLRSKTPAIPQPDKYRPPSHGRATPRSITETKTYGPRITDEEREQMRKKKYPNMMSPEGSFSHWFIHNRAIHAWITMGILLSLAVAAWYMDFMAKTVYAELVPTKKEFFRHPIESSKRFVEVYRMHVAQQTAEVQKQRLKKWEEVEKRKEYRLERIKEAEERGEEYVEDPRYYVDEDGIRRRRVKRWFGVWE